MPEQLTLAALREPLPDADAAHLAGCAECRAQVTSLQRAVDVLSVPEFATSGAPAAPPARVWDAIAAATGVSVSPGTAAAPLVADPPPPAPLPDDVRELRPRRARLLLAAAAVVAVAAGAGAIALDQDDEVVLASTSLAPLDATEAAGTATVVEKDDGSRWLRIELEAPDADDAYYEAWLADESAVGMVGMGSVRPGTTSLPLPGSLELTEWPTVEISVEPLDGDPGHSGTSLVRGALET
jgi:hypothetical protein